MMSFIIYICCGFALLGMFHELVEEKFESLDDSQKVGMVIGLGILILLWPLLLFFFLGVLFKEWVVS